MAETLSKLRSQAAQYVAQGRLLPGQPELLRQTALSTPFAESGKASLGAFPESLQNLQSGDFVFERDGVSFTETPAEEGLKELLEHLEVRV